MEAGWGGFGGLESEPLGFNDVWGHLGWGATGAAPFPIPARPPRLLAPLGCDQRV